MPLRVTLISERNFFRTRGKLEAKLFASSTLFPIDFRKTLQSSGDLLSKFVNWATREFSSSHFLALCKISCLTFHTKNEKFLRSQNDWAENLETEWNDFRLNAKKISHFLGSSHRFFPQFEGKTLLAKCMRSLVCCLIRFALPVKRGFAKQPLWWCACQPRGVCKAVNHPHKTLRHNKESLRLYNSRHGRKTRLREWWCKCSLPHVRIGRRSKTREEEKKWKQSSRGRRDASRMANKAEFDSTIICVWIWN